MELTEQIILACTILCFQHYVLHLQTVFTLLTFTCKHIAYQKACEVASRRKYTQRVRWSVFQTYLSDSHFRRYFRMNRKCFQDLCLAIEKAIGEENFLSEQFLDSLQHAHINKKIKIMHKAHEESTGGFISGEIKLAITLRLL